MATRPAWTIKNGKIIREDFAFEWHGGFAVVQKQKNIQGLHQAIMDKTGQRALEISSKSTADLGRSLSAFNLTLSGKPIESIFQAAKQYESGGPYDDLLEARPRDAKRDPRHTSSGKLTAFVRNGEVWPLEPKTAFYDAIYLTAVYEKYGSELNLSPYQWFTDIEFNPKKSINCQARAAAIYRLLQSAHGFEVLSSKEKWLAFHREYVVG